MILFHRSPIQAIQDGYIGYGWKQLNFSQYQNIDELLTEFKNRYPECNRHHNMIRRFFKLKAGDIVIVPVHRAIVVGEVIGDKRYIDNLAYGENQVKVNFFKKDGKVIKIDNSKLNTTLQARLRIRQSNISLNQDFSEEIHHIIDNIKNNGFYENNKLSEQENKAIELFKTNLLKNVQQQKTWIKAGGRGLEELIQELLQLEGYNANICAKNQSNGIDDIDVIAYKDDTFFANKLLVQAKHHQGTSNSLGITQLNEYKEENDEIFAIKKVFVTTADNINNTAEKLAEENNIKVILGKELVDWIYNNLPKLSQSTKEKLGVFESYQLVGD